MPSNFPHGLPSHRTVASGSGSATPASSRWTSAYNSAYPSEDDEPTPKRLSFRFLDLPTELRSKIYGYMFRDVPKVIDLDPDNFRLVHRKVASIFLVSKQIYDEASHHFYSTHAFRLFPCHAGRFFKTKKPLLARLSPRCRTCITTLELRLGPGFSAPPRGWVINEALGLSDCKNVRVLKVMVQIDPSSSFLKGFRKGDDGFYEKFSQALLYGVLKRVSSIREVQFDAYPGVSRHGPMMTGLIRVAREHKAQNLDRMVISWGPERNWADEVDEEQKESLLVDAIAGLSISEAAMGPASPTTAESSVQVSVFG